MTDAGPKQFPKMMYRGNETRIVDDEVSERDAVRDGWRDRPVGPIASPAPSIAPPPGPPSDANAIEALAMAQETHTEALDKLYAMIKQNTEALADVLDQIKGNTEAITALHGAVDAPVAKPAKSAKPAKDEG